MKKLILLALVCTSLSSVFANETVEINPYYMNPVSRFMPEEDFREIIESVAKKEKKRHFPGVILTVDTSDADACIETRKVLTNSEAEHKLLAQLDNACESPDFLRPYLTITMVNAQEHIKFERPVNTFFDSDAGKQLVNDSKYVAIGGAIVWGALYSMPTEVSQWHYAGHDGPGFDSFTDNIKKKPKKDNDGFLINFLGHPLSGAAYYSVARHAGVPAWKSFGYSVFMSTFFWEYGIEAIAEQASIQDLIITPIIGSLMGEFFYRMTKKIEDNGDKAFGSERFGRFLKGTMNPVGVLKNGINNTFGPVIEDAKIKLVNSSDYFYDQHRGDDFYDHHINDSGRMMLEIEFLF